MKKEIPEQYGRVKGADWFSHIFKRDIMILGQGGIGSWLTHELCKSGCNLFLYDHDTFEIHNMTGQVVRRQDMGKRKSDVAKEIARDFSPDCMITSDGMYRFESPVNPIMLCGFDKMAPRTLAFNKWEDFVNKLSPAEQKTCFFQDGRLNAEQLQIFSIAGDDRSHREEYRHNFLFSDEEVPEQDCTFTQTSHFAAMIAGHMIVFLTNWLTNAFGEEPVRTVPFFYEYFGPLNLTTCSPISLQMN